MGACRCKVGMASISNSEVEDSLEDATVKDSITESLVTEKESVGGTLHEEERHPSVGTENDSSIEEKVLHITGITTLQATAEDVTEGVLWKELEEELLRREMEPNTIAWEEEVALAAKEFTHEEISRMTIRSSASSSLLEGSTGQRPGPTTRAKERLGLYKTLSELCSKIRLSRTLMDDHYMPVYRKTTESLISQVEDDDLIDCWAPLFFGPTQIRKIKE